MKKNIARWIKAGLLILWIAFLIYLIWEVAGMARRDYGTWLANRSNVQERLYEAIYMFYYSAQTLVFNVALLIFAIWRLICIVREPKGPGKIVGWIREKGKYLATGCICIFVPLFLLEMELLWRITSIPETSEVPATLHENILLGKLAIAAEIAAIGAIAFLVSWKRGKGRRSRRSVNPADASPSVADAGARNKGGRQAD